MMYDHRNPTAFSASDCQESVGNKATITLTGTIVDWGSSHAGPFVKFQPDERWGFGDHRLVLDLDALVRGTEDAS